MPLDDEASYDAFMQVALLESFAHTQPQVLFVGYGETDNYAHQGRYDLVLASAHAFDHFVEELWNTLQALPRYKDQTTFIITTDHGRGGGLTEWKEHGVEEKGSENIWIAVMGPDTAPLGERAKVAEVHQAQIAATVAAFIGKDSARASRRPRRRSLRSSASVPDKSRTRDNGAGGPVPRSDKAPDDTHRLLVCRLCLAAIPYELPRTLRRRLLGRRSERPRRRRLVHHAALAHAHRDGRARREHHLHGRALPGAARHRLDRPQARLRRRELSFRALVIISLIGGALGALLLLSTPPTFFARLVPWLVLFATAVFAWGSFGPKRAGAAAARIASGPPAHSS